MNVAQDLRNRRKHRGLTPRQLVQKIGRLEREADNTACQLVGLTTEVDELTAERNQLQDDFDRAAVAYSGVLEELREATAELTELRAYKAEVEAVTVPPMHRDTSAVEDQATGPINVRPLWDALGTGPVTAPGQARRTSWGRGVDDTQPLTRVAPPAA